MTLNVMPNKGFKEREVIFRENDKPDGAYYICEGQVEVSRMIGGKHTVIAYLKEGDVFGELAMVDDRVRAATVSAVSEVWTYHFSARAFEQKLKDMDPFLHAVVMSLVHTIRSQNYQINQLKK